MPSVVLYVPCTDAREPGNAFSFLFIFFSNRKAMIAFVRESSNLSKTNIAFFKHHDYESPVTPATPESRAPSRAGFVGRGL